MNTRELADLNGVPVEFQERLNSAVFKLSPQLARFQSLGAPSVLAIRWEFCQVSKVEVSNPALQVILAGAIEDMRRQFSASNVIKYGRSWTLVSSQMIITSVLVEGSSLFFEASIVPEVTPDEILARMGFTAEGACYRREY
jgi:hypothetical protein